MKKHPKLITICCFLLIAVIALSSVFAIKFYKHEKKQTARLNSQKKQITELQKQLQELQTQGEKEFYGFYNKLTNKEDVNIIIIGDSIGAGVGATAPENAWAKKLPDWIQTNYGVNCSCTNVSMGANTSYAGYVRYKLLEGNTDYDLAVICYGQNDDEEKFSYFYESILRTVANTNSACTIIPILESSQYDYTNKMVEISKLANYYHLTIADTIRTFSECENGYNSLLADGIHPNDAGHEVYFETVKSIIEDGVDNEVTYEEMPLIPYNGNLGGFDQFTYLSKDQFVQVDDNAYEIEIDPTWAYFGIYRTYIYGPNDLRIYVDGELVSNDCTYYYQEVSISKIYRAYEEPIVINNGIIRLEFANQEVYDAFEGLILTQS